MTGYCGGPIVMILQVYNQKNTINNNDDGDNDNDNDNDYNDDKPQDLGLLAITIQKNI